MSFEYIKRVCDSELELKLEAFGAVHIVGPKWCGKTACRGGWPSSIFKKSESWARVTYHRARLKLKEDLKDEM